MAKADVIALVEDIAGDRSDTLNLTDSTLTDRYYTEAVYDYGTRFDGIVDAEFVAIVKGTATYTQPADTILPLILCYGERQLRPTARRAMEAYDPLWRTRQGTPEAFTTTDTNSHVWRLVSVPNRDGEPIGVLTPFDDEFPDENLLFFSTMQVDDVPAIDEFWLTWDILAREFSRESDHRDAAFAKMCSQLMVLFRTFVGFEEAPRG